MSRQVLPRQILLRKVLLGKVLRGVLAILAAYALALQPMVRVTVLHAFNGVTELCSSTADESAPPIDREHDHACCLGTCCSGLFGPDSIIAVAPGSTVGSQLFPLSQPQVLTQTKGRYPQPRAPPLWPA